MTRLRAIALVLPASLLGSALLATPPAHAGGVDPCNRTYEQIASAPLVSSTGETVGRMRLLTKAGTTQFCGRLHVRRGLDVRRNHVRLKLQVANATEASGYAWTRSPASDVDPIVIDARGYGPEAVVSYIAVLGGPERVVGELTAVVP